MATVANAEPPMIYSFSVNREMTIMTPANTTKGSIYANITALHRCLRVKQSSASMVHLSLKKHPLQSVSIKFSNL